MIEGLIAVWGANQRHASQLHSAYVATVSEDSEWLGRLSDAAHKARTAWVEADVATRLAATRLAEVLRGRVYTFPDGRFLVSCTDDSVEIREKYE